MSDDAERTLKAVRAVLDKDSLVASEKLSDIRSFLTTPHPTSAMKNLAPRQDDALLGVRPEVAAFAMLMESELLANTHKGGWKDDGATALAHRVKEKADELLGATIDNSTTRRARVRSEAADVANMAMMVADVCGCLIIPALRQDTGQAAALSEADRLREKFAQIVMPNPVPREQQRRFDQLMAGENDCLPQATPAPREQQRGDPAPRDLVREAAQEATLETIAEAIHLARWKEENAHLRHSLAEGDRTDREYCFRLARAVQKILPLNSTTVPAQRASQIGVKLGFKQAREVLETEADHELSGAIGCDPAFGKALQRAASIIDYALDRFLTGTDGGVR